MGEYGADMEAAQRIFDAAHRPHVDSTGGDYEGYCENDYGGCPLRDSMSAAIAVTVKRAREAETALRDDRERLKNWQELAQVQYHDLDVYRQRMEAAEAKLAKSHGS